jgi:hypothetical protein
MLTYLLRVHIVVSQRLGSTAIATESVQGVNNRHFTRGTGTFLSRRLRRCGLIIPLLLPLNSEDRSDAIAGCGVNHYVGEVVHTA